MNSFDDLVKLQGKIKRWIVIIVLMSIIVVADFLVFFAANMGTLPFEVDDTPAGTLAFLTLLFVPIIVIVIMACRFIECKTTFMNEYNNLFYVKAFENQEGVQIKDITVTDTKTDAYESHNTKTSIGDHDYLIYYKQSYLSIFADIAGIDAKIENIVKWNLSSDNLGPFYNLIVRSGRATSKDVEINGLLENTNRLTYKLYIYHKKYEKKDYIKKIKMYPTVTTSNDRIDKEYIIKSIDADKANKLINNNIKAYIERIVDFKMPMCIIMDGETIEFKIKSNDFKTYPPLSKKLDYNLETRRAEVVVNTFYKLFDELNNHN